MNNFTKSLVTDMDIQFQPEGTYRYMLNGVSETLDGELGGKTSELGNKLAASAPYPIIGHCNTNEANTVLFSTDNYNSEIGILNGETLEYTTLINDMCLNFSQDYPIHCLFRVTQGCEGTIYFTDNRNNYRSINLTDVQRYYKNGVLDCSSLNISPNYKVPSIDATGVREGGGSLSVGSYSFAVRLLDKDKNPSNWLLKTNEIKIIDDSYFAEYESIDGAINTYENASPEVGAVPTTNKVIDLLLENLDQNYAYYQLAVIIKATATGKVSEVWELDEQSIVGAQDSYTFTGASVDSGHFRSSLQDIVVPNEIIETVAHHEQIQNRLFLANLKASNEDYAAFQRSASNITVKYATKKATQYNLNSVGNPKNPLTSFKAMSLMGNEVYALGIQYLFKNSRFSSPYHIPGRAALLSDMIEVTPSSNTSGISTEPIPAWKVSSTADTLSKSLGYYEADESYPNITDCDGVRIFPEGKVRHHRMPNRRDEPISDGVDLNILGLEFDNIVYPSPDVVGHRFVISKRTEGTSTVIDTGVTIPNHRLYTNGEFSGYEWIGTHTITGGGSLEHTILVSPKTTLMGRRLNTDYFTFNSKINFPYDNSETKDFPLSIAQDMHMRIYAKSFNSYVPEPLTLINRKVLGNARVNPQTTQSTLPEFGGELVNDSYTQDINFIKLEDSADLYAWNYVSLMRNVSPYGYLDSIEYRPLDHNPRTIQDSQVFFNGDVWLTELNFVDIPEIDNTGLSKEALIYFYNQIIVESEINSSLRYGGTEDCNIYYKDYLPSNQPDFASHRGEYGMNRIATQQQNGKWDLKDLTDICPEFYRYNLDFSALSEEFIYRGLDNSFDYCNGCLNYYPHRIIYSEKSFQEDQSDRYRIFRQGNNNDLDGQTGAINALIVDKNALYAITKYAPYFIPTNPQQIQTNEDTVYLGTGSTLSLPPQRMVTSSSTYGGTTQPTSIIKTEFGTSYWDDSTGKVFLISGGLKEISNIGMRADIRNLGTFKLRGKKSFTNAERAGVMGVYDPIRRRIIYTFRDYEALSKVYLTTDNSPSGSIIYNEEEDLYYTKRASGVLSNISPQNPLYFRNKSITISFYLPKESWEGYHSYLPTYYFTRLNFMYSCLNDKIYSHSDKSAEELNFFGKKHPFIFEFIDNANPAQTKLYSSVLLSSKTYNIDEDRRDYSKDSFTGAVFYTSSQSTGLLGLELKDTNKLRLNDIDGSYIERVDDRVQISKLENKAINEQQPFSKKWQDIQNVYPVDKVANPLNTLGNKTLFDRGKLRGEWLGVRLYFNSDKNQKITLALASTNKRLSIR